MAGLRLPGLTLTVSRTPTDLEARPVVSWTASRSRGWPGPILAEETGPDMTHIG
jgi:hypothetical protein